MPELQITCPKCRASEPITIAWSNPTSGVHTMPNGDPGYPGDSGGIEEIKAGCGCWPDEVNEEDNDLLEKLIDAWMEWQYIEEAAMWESMEEAGNDA